MKDGTTATEYAHKKNRENWANNKDRYKMRERMQLRDRGRFKGKSKNINRVGLLVLSNT